MSREAKTGIPHKDLRQVFDDKDVQAVAMPLPNHWHALVTIWACHAGRNVYVEKPACHNPFECRKTTEAARAYNGMVQVGAQRRSTPHIMKAMDLLRRTDPKEPRVQSACPRRALHSHAGERGYEEPR